MRGPFGGTRFFGLVTTILLCAVSILARSQKPGTSGGGPSITTQINQRFEELKQDKAKIEQAVQSPDISRKQREQARQAAATIEKVITVAETALKDPALETDPERWEAILAQAQSVIAYSNALVSSTERDLGISRSGPADRVAAAKARIEGMLNSTNLEDYTMKVSRGFDGSKANSNDVSVPYVGTSTPFFGLGGNSSDPVSVKATYARTTPYYAKKNADGYGSAGGAPAGRLKVGGLGDSAGFVNGESQSDADSTKNTYHSSR